VVRVRPAARARLSGLDRRLAQRKDAALRVLIWSRRALAPSGMDSRRIWDSDAAVRHQLSALPSPAEAGRLVALHYSRMAKYFLRFHAALRPVNMLPCKPVANSVMW